MNDQQLYDLMEAFKKGIIGHDYSYPYSDDHNVYMRGSMGLRKLESQLLQLVKVHGVVAKDLLDTCLEIRSEQFKDGMTHTVIKSLFKPYVS